MVQIVKGAKEQQNNKAIPRTALPRLAVKNLTSSESKVCIISLSFLSIFVVGMYLYSALQWSNSFIKQPQEVALSQ